MRSAFNSCFISRLLIALLALAIWGQPSQADTPNNLQIYILMGQSNMVGQDASALASQVDDPRILALNGAGQWVVAREPIHVGGVGIGPGISFAKEMLKANPQTTIGLVPCAVSGSALNQWIRGAKAYKAALSRAKTAAVSGTLQGILWHQGETDTRSLLYAQTYEQRWAQAFQEFREDLGLPRIPIVVGQLGEFVPTDRFPFVQVMRGAIAHLPSDLPRVGFASSEGLVDKGDKLHFNVESAQVLGTRYAHEMLMVQQLPVLDSATVTFPLGRRIGVAQLANRVSGGKPLLYRIAAGTLPAGIKLETNGSFSGIPTKPTPEGGVTVTVAVTDGQGGWDSAKITVQVKNFNLIVNSTDDVPTTNTAKSDNQTTLREAINYANTKPGADTITFDPLVFHGPKTISLSTALPSLSSDVVLQGPGAKRLTIRSISRGEFDLFRVSNGANVTLDGLTLSRGRFGITNFGNVALSNCWLNLNTTALRNAGSASLLNCTFSDGQSGVSNLGIILAFNCTFSGNSQSGITNCGKASLTNCTLSGNGLGITNAATLTLMNTLVVGNRATNVSGDIKDGGSNVTSGTITAAGLDPAGLRDNGGPVLTIALVGYGTAINRGDNSLLPENLATDQRGIGYDRIVSKKVDIGAFEMKPNKAPTNITLSRNKVTEKAGANAGVGALIATDPDIGDTFTFSLPAGVDDNDQFTLLNNIQLCARESLDYSLKNSYLVTVTVTDTGGLSFSRQFLIIVTKETVKPTLRINTPSVGQSLFIKNFLQTSLTGVAQDNVGVVGVKVLLSRQRGTTRTFWNGSKFVAQAAPVSANLTGSTNVSWILAKQLPSAAQLDAGSYQVAVYAFDAAGNQSDLVERTFILKSDLTPPIVTLSSPTLNQKLLISEFTDGIVRGTATDAEGVVAVKVRLSRQNGTAKEYWDGQKFTPVAAFIDAEFRGTTRGTWEFKSQLPPAAQLMAGNYSVSAYALDEAGNKSQTISVAFVLDSDFTAPTVSIASPSDSQLVRIYELTGGSIRGQAEDNVRVASVNVRLQRYRGGKVQYWNGTAFVSTSTWLKASLTRGTGSAITWQLKQAIPASALDIGGYALYASAYDEAGNSATSTSRVFTITAGTRTPSAPISSSATAPSAGGS